MSDNQLRQEQKFIISGTDKMLICSRLQQRLRFDPYSVDGVYTVRSLYFDSLYDAALHENLAGSPSKTKYRLRLYNNDTRFIRLEKKIKQPNGSCKIGAVISVEDCNQILHRQTLPTDRRTNALLEEFGRMLDTGELRARCIIQYTRNAFECIQGHTRITIDSDIRACSHTDQFPQPDLIGVPLFEQNECVLEIKFNHFLPDYLVPMLGVRNCRQQAISKYVLARNYI